MNISASYKFLAEHWGENCIVINGEKIIDDVKEIDFDLQKSWQTIFPPRDKIINLKGGNNIEFITHEKNGKIVFRKTLETMKLEEYIENELKINHSTEFKFQYPLFEIDWNNAIINDNYGSIEICEWQHKYTIK